MAQGNGGIIGPANDPVFGDKITQFTNPGTYTALTPQGDVLVVGGGAGSGSQNSGGGGAGGVRFTPKHP